MAETNNKMMSMIQKLRMGVVGNKKENEKTAPSKPAAVQVQEVKEKLQISESAAVKNGQAENSIESAFNKVLANWEKQHKKQKEKPAPKNVNIEAFDFSFTYPTINESKKNVQQSADKGKVISETLAKLKSETSQSKEEIKLIIPEQLSDSEKEAVEGLARFIDDWVEKNS
jgi:hypothetical protein